MVRLLKKIVLFLTPLFIMSVCYVLTDPFKTIYRYKYYTSSYMLLSRGNVSTMVLLQNMDKYPYDSFVFGSSRSTAYTAREWAKYLPANSHPYSFEAWNENVEGLYIRLRLLDSLKIPIRNALLILDEDRAFKYSGDIVADHYLIRGESKFNYYQKDYLYYLKTPNLFISSIDYAIFKTRRSYMSSFVGMDSTDIDPVTNDWFPNSEAQIKADSLYYSGSDARFYKRPAVERYAHKQVDARQLVWLKKISALLTKHHTNYKVVISPLYNQVKLHKQDMALINQVFGPERVYDYSGINKITNSRFYYCNDVIHYRKNVGNLVLKEIYSADSKQPGQQLSNINTRPAH